MSELLKNLETLKKKQSELVKEIQKESQAYFKEACQDIFKTFPEIKEFSWAQYTPWFNDGDTCIFSVCDYTIKINGLSEEYDEDAKQIDKKAFKSVYKLINSIDEDTMEAMFGDHVEITVTPNKITTDAYEHD